MNIDYELKSGALFIMLDGEVDHSVSLETREAVDDIIADNPLQAVVFDLKKVGFMDSAGIGLIMGRYKLLKKENRTLFLTNVSGSVDKLLAISGIYNIVKKI